VILSDHISIIHFKQFTTMPTSIKSVALIGATSRIGPAIIAQLEASHSFTLTILQRESSKPPPPHSSASKILTLPNDLPHADLVEALTGIDALVSALPGSAVEPHRKLADACIEAKVSRFIPADYGSVDSSDPVVAELVPLYKQKTAVREYLTSLSAAHDFFTWTSIVPGHFFDYGLETELLGFDVRKGKAEIFDGGDLMWSAASLAQIGKAVVGVLKKPEETRDVMLYMQSFLVSQNEVLKVLEEIRGSKYQLEQMSSEKYIQEKKKLADQGDKEAVEQLVCVLGLTRANWTKEKHFAMELLGLEEEDMPTIVRQTLEEMK
jgi:putative NADH-flavin reductase